MNSVLLITVLSPVVFLMLTSFYPYRPGEYGLRKVVIDAGHGGKDPGAIGVDKMREKDVVLDIALKVGKKIKATYPEVEVVYTRDSDVFIGLSERANVANKINADLFLSIHADAAGSSAAYGTETFALGLHKSEANKALAKRENKSILLEDNYELKYEGIDPNSDESLIAITIFQQATLAESLNMGKKVQDEFTKIGRRNRGVKQAGFVVLWKTIMPSVLIETGFITNTKEGRFLNKGENRTTIANAIFKAFGAYKADVDAEASGIKKSPDVKVDKPKQKKTESDSEVRFRVQVMSSPKSIDMKPENFKGLTDIRELLIKGSYKYTIGNAATFEDGVNLQAMVREKGFKDAFLIGVYQGRKIPISEAKSLLKKGSK